MPRRGATCLLAGTEAAHPAPDLGPRCNVANASYRQIVIGDLLTRLQSDQGHIVIRVDDGGEQHRVIILDDSTGNVPVKAVHGPYAAR